MCSVGHPHVSPGRGQGPQHQHHGDPGAASRTRQEVSGSCYVRGTEGTGRERQNVVSILVNFEFLFRLVCAQTLEDFLYEEGTSRSICGRIKKGGMEGADA